MWGAGKCSRSRVTAEGFTLIEMLVTLAVLSLVVGIAFPSVEKAIRYQEFLNSCTRIEGFLRTARAIAIRQGKPVQLRGSADRHSLSFGSEIEHFPTTTYVTLPMNGISFFPDGSVQGGMVSMQDRKLARSWMIQASTGVIVRAP